MSEQLLPVAIAEGGQPSQPLDKLHEPYPLQKDFYSGPEGAVWRRPNPGETPVIPEAIQDQALREYFGENR